MNRYSPSRIQTFDQCKLKFKLHYLDKIEVPEPISYPANFGSFVHEFAEHFGKKPIKELIKLQRNYELNEEYKQIIAPTLKNTIKFLEKYDKYEFEPEQEFTYKNDRIWLYGIVDRIMHTNDGVTFVDYKTAKFPNREKYMFQMSFYNFMIAKKYDKDPKDVKCIIFEAGIYRKIEQIETNTNWEYTKSGLCPWCKYANTEHCPIKVEKRI